MPSFTRVRLFLIGSWALALLTHCGSEKTVGTSFFDGETPITDYTNVLPAEPTTQYVGHSTQKAPQAVAGSTDLFGLFFAPDNMEGPDNIAVRKLLMASVASNTSICPSRWVYTSYNCYRETKEARICGHTRDHQSRSCRHPIVGRESTNVCGVPEYPLDFSESGAAHADLSDIPATSPINAPVRIACLTCDNLPHATFEHYVDKISCLKANFLMMQNEQHKPTSTRILAPLGDLSNITESLRWRGAMLFEAIYNAAITGNDVLPLYAVEPATPYTDEEEKSTPASILLARFALCRALLGNHVDARRIASEYEACLQASTSRTGAATSDPNKSYASQNLMLGLQLFGQYVRHVGRDDLAENDGAQAAHAMAETWYRYAVPAMGQVDATHADKIRTVMHAFAKQRLEP